MILRPRLPLPRYPHPNSLPDLLRPRQHTQHQRRRWHSLYARSPRRSPHPSLFRRPHDANTTTRPLNNPTTHPSTLSHRRTFTSTPSIHAQPPETHYDILGVPPTTDAPTLKKRFYTLSRQHHPDLHPTDPHAVQRFQQISESYSILSDPQKRAHYDRDVVRLHHQKHVRRGGPGGGPATYAGSRPPSGLSKRRSAGIFRGPPPSYFAQGGGGSYQAGRNPYTRGPEGEAATAGGAGGAWQSQSQANSSTATDGFGGGVGGGTTAGAGAWGPTDGTAGDFDSSGVYRTQTHEDRKREARRAAAMAAAQQAAEDDGDFGARFVIVTSAFLGALMIGSLFVGQWTETGSKRGAGGMVKGDGSRRDKDRS